MKRRILLVILAISIALVGCGKKSENIQKEAKEQHVQDENFDDISEETVKIKEEKKEIEDEKDVTTNVQEGKEEQKAGEETPAKNEQKQPTTTTQTATKKEETKNPVVQTPTVTPTQPENKVETCEHWYQPEFKPCENIKEMVWACNGCGYPLFTIENGKPVHFENMYSHPAHYSEKLGFDCTGGGFHSEMYYSGYCYGCHERISWRQCMFSETGKMCVKNEALGAYEKIELGRNPQAYWESCSCGKNGFMSGETVSEEGYYGVLIMKETCMYCGDVIHYPQK